MLGRSVLVRLIQISDVMFINLNIYKLFINDLNYVN